MNPRMVHGVFTILTLHPYVVLWGVADTRRGEKLYEWLAK